MVLEPGGLLEIGIQVERVDEGRSLPPAFVASALRQDETASEVSRVLCQRVDEPSGRGAGSYKCPVPADLVALKVALEGFGTEVLWDLSLSPGGSVPAEISLAPAVRLVGSVQSSGLSARVIPRGLQGGGREAELASEMCELPEGGPFEGRGRRAQVWTDDDGQFELWGIEPGELQIGALMGEPTRESAWETVHLEEDMESPWVELILEEKSPLTVHVSSGGRPVGGATVTALILDGMSVNGMTGPTGTVTLEVPPRKAGTLVVVAPGFGAVLENMPPMGTGGDHGARRLIELSPARGSLALTRLRAGILDGGWLISEQGGTVPIRTVWNLLPDVTSSGVGITIAALSPGTYTVCSSQNRCWQSTVLAETVNELDLSAEE